ncbi:carboxymethylenebutenolidase, partial [Tanacetum coccineum]
MKALLRVVTDCKVIVGSSNGLLCIYFCDNELEVANPSTREEAYIKEALCSLLLDYSLIPSNSHDTTSILSDMKLKNKFAPKLALMIFLNVKAASVYVSATSVSCFVILYNSTCFHMYCLVFVTITNVLDKYKKNLAAMCNHAVDEIFTPTKRRELACTAFDYAISSIKWMVDEFIAVGSSKKFGIVGFCFGGGKVPVLYITGDEDPLCSVQVLEDIKGNNVGGSRVVVFKGRGHGFVHRPATAEDDQDAEEAFTIMRNWLHNRQQICK